MFGFFIDKTGKNVFWVIGGVLVTLGCHALLAFTFVNPYIAMVMFIATAHHIIIFYTYNVTLYFKTTHTATNLRFSIEDGW